MQAETQKATLSVCYWIEEDEETSTDVYFSHNLKLGRTALP